MSWLRVDDAFPRHPKVVSLCDGAYRLHVNGMAYCAEHETDGVLSPAAVESLTLHRRKEKLIAELLDAGVWELGAGATYRIHDYLDWNPSHAQLEAKRAAACERMNGVRSHSVRANKQRTTSEQDANFARTSREPVSTPSRPVPDPPTESKALPRARDPSTTGTAAFHEVWRAVTDREPSYNPTVLAEAIRLSGAEAREDVLAFMQLRDFWTKNSRPEPPLTIEAFVKHHSRVRDWRDGRKPSVAANESRRMETAPRHTPGEYKPEPIERAEMPSEFRNLTANLAAGKVTP